MQIYKFLDVTTSLPDDSVPILVLASHNRGTSVRAMIDESFADVLAKASPAEKMRTIKELLAIVENSLLQYSSKKCN